MTVFNKSHLAPVVEKYVGSNPAELEKVEKELASLLKIIYDQFKPLSVRMTDKDFNIMQGKSVSVVNDSVHNKKIEELLTKYFGLKGVNLVWMDSGAPNAMTPCRSFSFLSGDKRDKKTGRYTDGKLRISMLFDVNLVTYLELNEKEVLAIILHEIGHNFYNSVFHLLSRMPINLVLLFKQGFDNRSVEVLAQYVQTYALFDIIDYPNLYVKLKKVIDSTLEKFAKPVVVLFRLYNEFMYNLLGIFKLRVRLTPDMIIGSLDYLLLRFASTDIIFGYHAERFSDDFAVDHGYGNDLASALAKMDEQKHNISVQAIKNIPGLNWFADFISVQLNFVMLMMDSHPASITRIRAGLDRLKKHLNDPNLDARTKKDLEEQIKEYEQFYADYIDIGLENDDNKKNIFSWLNKVFLNKVFGGKDIRELTWALDRYNRL